MIEKGKRILIDTTPSTNTFARDLIAQLPHLSLVRTDCQSSGRGQRGNSWEAEPGKNLTVSYILKPVDFRALNQFRVNEGVALAVIDTLAEFGIESRIKWPNDIYVGDNKICGILIEHSVMGESLISSIVGIGLNVNQKLFLSDAPNPVSMIQFLDRELDLDEVERYLTDSLARRLDFLKTGEPEHKTSMRRLEFKKNLWRADGRYYPFEDLRDKGNPRIYKARIADVLPVGLLRLEDEVGVRIDYGFKEIRYILT